MRRFRWSFSGLFKALRLVAVGLACCTVSARAAGEAAAFPVVDGLIKADFDRLAAFKVEPPPFDPKAAPGSEGPSLGKQIPDEIRALDGRKAVVTGFMLPIKMEGGKVTELLLMRTQMMCCYGVVPQLNEWILVRMPKGALQLMDVPVSFSGVLRVKELYENGFLTAIYALDGDKMLPTKK
ncbi:MAG: DUF3299 domain-containing protein [Nibricoccus sp.]